MKNHKKNEQLHEHSHDGTCCNHDTHVEKGVEMKSTHEHTSCSCSEEHGEDDDVGDIQGRYKFKMVGLDCANCASKIEKKLRAEPYVQSASVNFSTETLAVEPSQKMKIEALKQQLTKAIKSVEPDVELVDVKAKVEAKPWKEVIHLAVGVVIFILALYFEDKGIMDAFYWFLIPYLFIGYKVLWKSITNILKGDIFDENFLMSIATIGAFFVGAYEEAVEVMLFYSVGEIFQSYAVYKSRRSISDLLDIQSEYANIISQDGEERKVDPQTLQLNDLIVVRAGEKVPVDGIIVDGSSALDVSALNGEANLRDVYPKDDILAGSINMSGLLKVKVTKTFANSTVSKILELVENAANKKAPIENFITKFARIYTPIVVGLAVLLVIIPTLLYGTDEFYTWLYRGCTFLVISCPCALVVSVPLGVFAGIGSASRIGALVKGGNYLELLNDVNYIILDKTGTITKGNFSVSEVSGDDKVLEYAAYAESYSNHPIAQSIMKKFNQPIEANRLDKYQELAGYGVEVLLDNKVLLVGNERLMEQSKITYPKVQVLGTIVYVAYDGHFSGYIVIRDELKPTSKNAIQTIKQLGIKTVMLSGDRKEIADYVANEVGIDEVYSQLLPQDKVTILEKYMEDESHTVAFVGDGINDAPALVRADIGVSMGGIGSDVAIEASDLVLMDDNLDILPKAIKISKKTKKIVIQNIVLALSVKIVILLLTTIGLANMKLGVFADVGVTLLAIINSMRALQAYKRV